MLVACYYLPHFGVACERTRLTHLWGEPVGLAGDDNRLRAVSEEAEKLGIRAGQAVPGARAFCPQMTVLPYDRPAYEDAARCLWDLFAIESSVVEPVSPETCFVEMTGPDILSRVRQLAIDIAVRVRVPVMVGLAKSRFVAEIAAAQDTAGGVVSVPIGLEAAFLSPLPIDHIPKLDVKLRQRLQRLGVKTLGDVLALPPRELQRQFRDLGLLLHRLAHGEDGERVRPRWPPPAIEQGIEFEDEVADEATLHEALRRCAARIAGRLMTGHAFCRTLALRLAQADGTRLEQREDLGLPADDAEALTRAALRLLGRMPLEQPLLGVALRAGGLGVGSGVQLALLDDNPSLHGLPHERRSRLEATLNFLRKRFGIGAVLPAGLLRQARRIRLWTYPLGHLLDEPVKVATNARGTPVRYWRRGRARDVKSIQNRWRETEWMWGRTAERTVYRVEVEPSGLSELHELGVQWRLAATAD